LDNPQPSIYSEVDEGSTTIPVMGSTLCTKCIGEMVNYIFICPMNFVYHSMKQITIYTLSETNVVRYIGKTKNSISYRLKQHIRESMLMQKKGLKATRKQNWIIEQLTLGNVPTITQLEIVEENNWKEREMYWIQFYKNLGNDLTNLTDGGDGNNNQKQSAESNLKRSNSLKGRKRPQEVKDKISKSHIGKIVSESTKQKLRNINLGKKQSESSKKKKEVPVYLLDINGNIVKEYESILKASISIGCRPGNISNVCRKFSKTAGGCRWAYKNIKDIV
jgi:group I intron endonuclease